VVYPGVYPRLPSSLILLGKINAAETDEEDFHTGTCECNLMIARLIPSRRVLLKPAPRDKWSCDGNGLYLRVRATGGRSWVLRRYAEAPHYVDQGSNTILPPTPPLSMRAWTSLAAASGSRSITTG